MATDQTDETPDFVFLKKDQAGWWVAGGLAAIGFGLVAFVISLFTPQSSPVSHVIMTTMPILFGIGALAAGWNIARTPRQVIIGPNGICIEGRRGQVEYSWEQLGWATVTPGIMNMRRHLVLYDSEGNVIAKLSDAFEGFELMDELITKRLQAKPDDTAETVRMRKSRRSAVMTVGFSLVMLVVAGLNVWFAHSEERAARLLAEAGTKGEAKILRRFLAPNGVTPRIEYEIATAEGLKGTRNAEATRAYWDSLEDATTVPVVYVPQEPSISRLAAGEPEEKGFASSPLTMYVLSAVIGVMCLVFIAAGVMQWHGWDIDLDSKTKKVSIKRFGTGR